MSRLRIDFGGDSWAGHRQSHWLEFAGRPQFPDYLRIVFVAYGRHAANGHARLDRGELSRYLMRQDGTLPDRRNIWQSIAMAKSLGYLCEESNALCLVVPGDHVQGGQGNPTSPCTRDHTRRTNVVENPRPFGRNVVTETGRSRTNVVTDLRRSTLNPSLLSTNATEDAS